MGCGSAQPHAPGGLLTGGEREACVPKGVGPAGRSDRRGRRTLKARSSRLPRGWWSDVTGCARVTGASPGDSVNVTKAPVTWRASPWSAEDG